jgi:predicted P-loop ATPase/GTPase
MAKKNVSARVPPQIADGLDEYAEEWNLNRTEAMTVLLKSALEDPPNPRQVDEGGEVNPTNRVYTVELEPENAEHLEEVLEDSDSTADEAINRVLSIYS